MIIPELSVDTIEYPLTMSETLVIGSGHSRVTEVYHQILIGKSNVKNYFYSLNRGLIESLAYDAEKDRVLYLKLLTNYFRKRIEKIIIFTDICIGDKPEELYLAKREKRKKAALVAKEYVYSIFRNHQPNLKIDCYIITVDGDKKHVHRIAENVEELQKVVFKQSAELAQTV